MKRELLFWVIGLVLLFGCLVFLTECSFPIESQYPEQAVIPPEPMPRRAAIELIEDGLIEIRSKTNANGYGSGIVVSYNDSNFLLTAQHVIGGSFGRTEATNEIQQACHVKDFESGRIFDVVCNYMYLIDCGMILPDGNVDMALLPIGEIPGVTPLPITAPPAWHIGDAIWQGGFGGDAGTISSGYITGRWDTHYIYADINTWNGSSGGPVLNEYGQVIGITVSVRRDFANGFSQVIDGMRGVAIIPSSLIDNLEIFTPPGDCPYL